MKIPNLYKRQFICIFLLIGVLSIQPVPVYALALDLEAVKPLKALDFLPEDEFQDATKIVKNTPYEDRLLAFKVRLPKAWTEVTTNSSQISIIKDSGVPEDILGTVVEYASPPKNYLRSRFIIEALELPHEIGARNWFIHYVLKNGLSLEQVGLENEGQVEALYIEVDGDISYVVRVKAIINGPRMVLAKYALPVEHYETEHVQQAQVVDSFDLTNRQEVNIEKLNLHGFLDQSYFDYPESWILSAPRVRSINRMQAMALHYNETGMLAGQINIFLANKSLGTSRSDELKYYRDKFDIENYEIGKLIESPKMQFHPDMTFGVTQAYEMKSTNSELIDYELWVSVIENDSYYYIMSLLTASRDEDFYTWARNIATYKLMVGNLRRNDSSENRYQFIQ